MQDIVVENEIETPSFETIITEIRRGEPVERIASILHVPQQTIESILDQYVMSKMF